MRLLPFGTALLFLLCVLPPAASWPPKLDWPPKLPSLPRWPPKIPVTGDVDFNVRFEGLSETGLALLDASKELRKALGNIQTNIQLGSTEQKLLEGLIGQLDKAQGTALDVTDRIAEGVKDVTKLGDRAVDLGREGLLELSNLRETMRDVTTRLGDQFSDALIKSSREMSTATKEVRLALIDAAEAARSMSNQWHSSFERTSDAIVSRVDIFTSIWVNTTDRLFFIGSLFLGALFMIFFLFVLSRMTPLPDASRDLIASFSAMANALAPPALLIWLFLTIYSSSGVPGAGDAALTAVYAVLSSAGILFCALTIVWPLFRLCSGTTILPHVARRPAAFLLFAVVVGGSVYAIDKNAQIAPAPQALELRLIAHRLDQAEDMLLHLDTELKSLQARFVKFEEIVLQRLNEAEEKLQRLTKELGQIRSEQLELKQRVKQAEDKLVNLANDLTRTQAGLLNLKQRQKVWKPLQLLDGFKSVLDGSGVGPWEPASYLEDGDRVYFRGTVKYSGEGKKGHRSAVLPGHLCPPKTLTFAIIGYVPGESFPATLYVYRKGADCFLEGCEATFSLSSISYSLS